MEIFKELKSCLKYGAKAARLQCDEKEIFSNNGFIVFDTGANSENIGDHIINYYCQKEFSKIGLNIVRRIPTHSEVSENDNRFLLENGISMGKIITGTNIICKNIFASEQWKKPIIDKRLSHIILMGCGVDNYKGGLFWPSRMFYRTFLDKNHLHSVRDSVSESILRNIGIENVINTACPTMWMLTPEFCRTINPYKTDDVVTTVTEYDKSPIDFAILDILLKHYRNVYLWLQSEKDLPYIKNYHNYSKLKIVGAKLCDYNTLLDNENIEYIGTRLHGGIHALNKGKRTLIIAVDGRGLTIGKDTNLPVENRYTVIGKLESLIKSPRKTYISLPVENISIWRQSIEGKIKNM